MPDGGEPGVEARARAAVADVGREPLGTGLGELGGVSVAVTGSTARLVVTLPVPEPALRDRLEAALREAVAALDGVAEVAVAWAPAAADAGRRVDLLPDVKTVVGVSSGKGGVGKSTVAANLAVALADAGAAVGLLDADVYGPNAPALLGLTDGSPETTPDGRIVPRTAHGVRVMSMAFVVGEDDPIIWRGPMVDDVLTQFGRDVEWGPLDYLVVDLPPGTGDAQLTLLQHLPVTGAVVVTTPQPVAVDDARRGLRGFARYDVPVLGVVENMSGFTCPDCGHTEAVFGAGGGSALAGESDVPLLGRVPVDPSVGAPSSDPTPPGVTLPYVGRVGLPRTAGERDERLRPVVTVDGSSTGDALRRIATRVAARVNQVVVAEGDPPSPDPPG